MVMITHSPLAWEHVQVGGSRDCPAGMWTGLVGGCWSRILLVLQGLMGWRAPAACRCPRWGAAHGRLQTPVPPAPACPLQFKDVAVKVKAAETLYKGISFYLEEHPDLLNDLLKVGGASPARCCTALHCTAPQCELGQHASCRHAVHCAHAALACETPRGSPFHTHTHPRTHAGC